MFGFTRCAPLLAALMATPLFILCCATPEPQESDWEIEDHEGMSIALEAGETRVWRVWATATAEAFPEGEYESRLDAELTFPSHDEWPDSTTRVDAVLTLEEGPDFVVAEGSLAENEDQTARLEVWDPWVDCAGEDGCVTDVYLLTLTHSGSNALWLPLRISAGVWQETTDQSPIEDSTIVLLLEEL